MKKTKPKPTVLAEGKFLRLVRQGKWEFVQRTNVSGVVGIVAVTDEGKLILVEQDRLPVGKPVIELPAGLVGDSKGDRKESAADAARRELLEETGYQAKKMIELAAGVSSAGMTDEVVTLFLAQGLRKTGAGKGDGGENITLHEVPLSQVPRWLEKKVRAGRLLDFKIYAGLHFAQRNSC